MRPSPVLVARLREHQLAGYLGITPVSLSRLKARERSRPSTPRTERD